MDYDLWLSFLKRVMRFKYNYNFYSPGIAIDSILTRMVANVVHATGSEDRTPHRTHHSAPQTHIFLMSRTFGHPAHMRWLQGLTDRDELRLVVRVILKSPSIVSCPIAISWVCLPILLAFLLYWRRNCAQTAPIHGLVHGLSVWLNRARSQVVSPTA